MFLPFLCVRMHSIAANAKDQDQDQDQEGRRLRQAGESGCHTLSGTIWDKVCCLLNHAYRRHTPHSCPQVNPLLHSQSCGSLQAAGPQCPSGACGHKSERVGGGSLFVRQFKGPLCVMSLCELKGSRHILTRSFQESFSCTVY